MPVLTNVKDSSTPRSQHYSPPQDAAPAVSNGNTLFQGADPVTQGVSLTGVQPIDPQVSGNTSPNGLGNVVPDTLPSFPSGVTQTPCGDIVGSVTVVGSQTVTIGKTVFGQGTNNVVACTAPTGRGGR